MPLFRRKDGDLVRDVPAYRRIMPLLMRGRNEAAVYFEQRIDAGPALEVIGRWNAAHEAQRITFFHLLVHALVKTLVDRPRLNRFTSGGRLYQRRGIWVSYSAKKAFDDASPVFVAKQQLDPNATFARLVAQIHGNVREGRSDKKSHVDKELGILLRLPIVVLRFLLWLVRRLDGWNLLPHRAFILGDPMYASVFVANLGSLKLDAAFHHNYEYGNIPIFVTIGQLHEVPFVGPDGTVGVRKEIVLRWTLDERIEDGLYCAKALDLLRERLERPEELARQLQSEEPKCA